MHIAILCISAVAICTGRVEAKGQAHLRTCSSMRCNLHGACGGKAKRHCKSAALQPLQSARGVWRQSHCCSLLINSRRCNLHGACGGKGVTARYATAPVCVAICTGRVEAKATSCKTRWRYHRCNLHGACGGKGRMCLLSRNKEQLQSARGVWRQRHWLPAPSRHFVVAICTGRVEAKE